MILEDESVVLRPGRDTVTETLTVPLNSFKLDSDSAMMPDVVRGILIVEGLALNEKSGASWTERRTVLVCERDVEFPVMVIV